MFKCAKYQINRRCCFCWRNEMELPRVIIWDHSSLSLGAVRKLAELFCVIFTSKVSSCVNYSPNTTSISKFQVLTAPMLFAIPLNFTYIIYLQGYYQKNTFLFWLAHTAIIVFTPAAVRICVQCILKIEDSVVTSSSVSLSNNIQGDQ